MAIARQGSPFEPSPSPQPHPQPPTKRDVRRNRIMEKLQGMINSFSANQHQHYRAQLQGVQVDMTLVLRADPYNDGPLADHHDDIRELIESIMRGDANGNGGVNLPSDDAAKNDYWSLAGKRYSEFVHRVNDAIEERDADLTALHNNYETALQELERLYQQRLHQAEEEHKALSATIRQRLATQLNKKRQQLLRDKEQLDIADSNAMLLHPNHFSIGNNPGSPSHNGTAINKRTRHLRHHRGASPVPGGAESNENGKRKRKLGQMDDDQGNESPAPHLAGGRSPFKDARSQREYTQFEAPAYSLERLFTEKELAMATNTAQEATYRHFHQPKQQEPVPTSNGTAGSSINGEVVESAEVVPEEQMLDAEASTVGNGTNTPPPSEPLATVVAMERSASHQVLTRGGARANPLAALADAATSEPLLKRNPFTPAAPRYHAITKTEKSGAPAPPPVEAMELENDMHMLEQAQMDDKPGVTAEVAEEAREFRRNLLDQALGISSVQAPYRLPQLETGPGAMIDRRGIEREPRTGFAPLPQVITHIESRGRIGTGNSMAAALRGQIHIGAEPMSRTTSAGGASERGGRGR